MKEGKVVQLFGRGVNAKGILRRLIGQQGFHLVDRGGYQGNVLRIMHGTVPNSILLQMYVVFIDTQHSYIAKVEEVRPVGDKSSARDLVLGPFGDFNQTGVNAVTKHGVHVLYGPVNRGLNNYPRPDPNDHGSWKPLNLPSLR